MVELNIFIETAIITTLIFAAGVGAGLLLSQEKINVLEKAINNLERDINDAELQFMLLNILEKEASCTYMVKIANKLGEESNKMAIEVEKYENSQKIDNSAFIELKKKYTNTIIRNWITLEKIKKTCKEEYFTVLYFYSNIECNKCEEQGIVLSYMKDKLGQNILTFALDADLGVEAVDVLKEIYNVTSYPTVVINGKKYLDFIDKNELISILCTINKKLVVC